MRLGDGFLVPAAPVVEEPHQPTLEELRNEQLLVAIGALQDALLNMPRPEVHVEAPDLTAIVQAVTGLKPGATSEDIAEAVVRQISPATTQTDVSEVLGKLVKAMERLDFRMQGAASSGGVVIPNPDVTDRADRELGRVSINGFADNRSLAERMFARAPQRGNSLYLDTADPTYIYIAEGLTSDLTGSSVQGIRVVKDAQGNPLGRVQQATGFVWADRASATWV